MKNTTTKYKNGQSIRLKNKRITVSKEGEKIHVSLQAILPKEELHFSGNGIRGNYKQTCFALSMEAAFALCISLKEALLPNENGDVG